MTDDDECTCSFFFFGVQRVDTDDCPVHGEDGDTYRDSLIDDELGVTR
jgi:hypothetical protein